MCENKTVRQGNQQPPVPPLALHQHAFIHAKIFQLSSQGSFTVNIILQQTLLFLADKVIGTLSFMV
jgi:hypothetical protein